MEKASDKNVCLTVECAFSPLNRRKLFSRAYGNKKLINDCGVSDTVRSKSIMASNVLVKDIMTKEVHVARNDTSVAEVVATMAKFDLSYMMVVMSNKPTGIITEHDILVRLVSQGIAPSAVIARMVYTNPIFTIDQEATVEEAVKMMNHWGVKHLPVTGKEGELVGVLTTDNVIFAVPSMLSALEELCRPGYKRVR
jgi:CBS domain-containing protein